MASQPNPSSDGPQGRSYTSPAPSRPMYSAGGSYDARPGPQGFVPPPAVNDAFGAYINSAPTFRRDNVSIYGGSEPAVPLPFAQQGYGVPSRMNSVASARYYRNPFHVYDEGRLPFSENSKWQQPDGEGATRNLRRPVRQASKGFVANDPFKKARLGKKRDEIPDDLTFDNIDAYPTGYTPAAPPRLDPPPPLGAQPSAPSPTSFQPPQSYVHQPPASAASQPPSQAYQSAPRPLSLHSYHAAQSPIQPQQTGSSSVPAKRPQAPIYPPPQLLAQLAGYSPTPPPLPQRFNEYNHGYPPPVNSNADMTSSATPPPRLTPLSPTGTPPPGHEPSRHSLVMNDFGRTTFAPGLEDRSSSYPAPPLTAITEWTEPSQTNTHLPPEDEPFTRPNRLSYHPYEEYSAPYGPVPYHPPSGYGDAGNEQLELQVSPDFGDKDQKWWEKTVSFFAFVGIILCLPIILPLRLLRRKKRRNTYKFDGSQAYHEVTPSESSSTQVPSKVDIAVLVSKRIPRVLYHHVLLRLPSLYFSRVARIFEEADLSLNDLKKMALELASKNLNTAPHTHMAHYGFFEGSGRIKMPPAYESLKHTWEEFINNLLREWKTFNLISVLLLSAILTILQIDEAGKDPFTRYFALSSLVCALVSLLYGCMYIIRFGTMRKPYKAAEWALEAKKSRTVFYWNVWVMLAMPAVYLAWSLLLFICCIMAFVWRTGFPEKDASDPSLTPTPVAEKHMMIMRGIVSAILALGLIYGILIVSTFQRYGQRMDRAWRTRIDGWIEEKAAIEEEDRKCAGEYGYQPPSQTYPASGQQPQAPPLASYRPPGEGAGQPQHDRSGTLRHANEKGSMQQAEPTNQPPGVPFSGSRRATVRDEDSDADSIGKRSDEDGSEEGGGGVPDTIFAAVNFGAKAAVLPPIRPTPSSLNIQRTTTPESVQSLGRDSATQFSIEMMKRIEEEDEETAPSASGHSLTQAKHKRGRSEGVKAVPEVVREGTKQQRPEAVPHRDKQDTIRAKHAYEISEASSSHTSLTQSSTTIGITKIPPTPQTLSTLTSPNPSLPPRALSPRGSLRRAPPPPPPPPQVSKKPSISIVTPFVPPPPPPPLLTPKITTSTMSEAAHSPIYLPPPLPPRPPELLEGLETVSTSLIPPSPVRTRHDDDGGSPFASSSTFGSSTNASPNASFEVIDSEAIPLLRTSSTASGSTEFGLVPSESHDYHSPLLSAPARKGAKPKSPSSSYKAGHSPQVSMDDLMKGLSALSSGPASSSNSPSLASGSRNRGGASQDTKIRTPIGESSSYSAIDNTPPTGSLLLSTPSPSHDSSTGATPITPPPATYSSRRLGHDNRPSDLGVDLLTMPRRPSGSGEVTRTVSQERSEAEDEVDIDARLDELFAKKTRGG